ncbi:nucleotide exchange factor GrpE [Aquimarina sp. ERC-38]|uniref:nucleotide exchange factor GrpE n=1 Tax=Aquimarina sp. ERC-38 TaxID=2949996 RepID=UPI0022485D9A|nr:nucleotide exchange factor GrpE [Aquimarina sp. ERC-38]UZO80913.1 nucleotide exchange factor GrpE [Aquimarina sp. ERC-38]
MSKKDNKQKDLADQVEEVLDTAIDDIEDSKGESEDGEKEEGLQEQVQKEKDKFLRLFAEFENYKKRTSKERIELFKTAGQEVLQSMIPVLDDFDRAWKEIEKSEDENLVTGVKLIHNKLKETLNSKGLSEMKIEVGDTFNADAHEAITQIPAPSEDLKGKIVDVIEKGYQLGDKIIRFPKVVTGQ